MGLRVLLCSSSSPGTHSHHGRRALQHTEHLRSSGSAVSTVVLSDHDPGHVAPHDADLVVAVGWRAARAAAVTFRGVPQLVDTAEVEFPTTARRAFAGARDPSPLAEGFADLLEGELAAYARAELVIAATRADAALVADFVGNPGVVRVVATAMAVATAAPSLRHGLVFPADLEDAVDRDAAAWLCRHIAPELPADLIVEHPMVVVATSATAEQRRTLAAAGVALEIVTSDVMDRVASAQAVLVPSVLGARGHDLAVGSMLASTPVVGSHLLAGTFSAAMRHGVRGADRQADFVRATVGAARGHVAPLADELRAELAAQASPERARGALLAAVDTVMASERRRRDAGGRRDVGQSSGHPEADLSEGQTGAVAATSR